MSPFPHSDDPSEAHEGDRSKAESTFAWFAARREAGEGPDFEAFVAEQGVHLFEFHDLEALARDGVWEFCYVGLTNKIAGTAAGFAMRPIALR